VHETETADTIMGEAQQKDSAEGSTAAAGAESLVTLKSIMAELAAFKSDMQKKDAAFKEEMMKKEQEVQKKDETFKEEMQKKEQQVQKKDEMIPSYSPRARARRTTSRSRCRPAARWSSW